MSNLVGEIPQDRVSEAEIDPYQAAVRFLAILRRRNRYVIAALAATVLSGAVYFQIAPRIYEASAALLVTHTGNDVGDSPLTGSQSAEALLPTYERLFTSDIVLEGALAHLQEMSPDVRIDFSSLPEDKWISLLRTNLSAKAVKRTNLIEIRYRSRSGEAAETVVGAVVRSYLDFMAKNHKDVSVDVLAFLGKERGEVEARLLKKQQELLDVQSRVGDLGMREDGLVEHPLVQRLVSLNDALVEVQEERLRLEAALVAIRSSLRDETDLRQQLVAIEPVVGRELILGALGLDPRGIEGITTTVRQLLEDRARLNTLMASHGPENPDVLEKRRAVELAEQHLADYNRHANEQLDKTSGKPFSARLLSMVEERLAATKSYEDGLSKQYATTETGAIQLHNQLAELSLVKGELDRLRRTHDALLTRIESIDMRRDQASLRIAVVGKPTASDTPVSPRLALIATLCLLGGLGIGLLIVYALELRDASLRSLIEPVERSHAAAPATIERGLAA